MTLHQPNCWSSTQYFAALAAKLILLLALVLQPLPLAAEEIEQDINDCAWMQNNSTFPMPRNLPRDLRERGNQLLNWGRHLANGLLKVEALLESDDVAVQNLSQDGLAWAAVVDGEFHRIGLYKVSKESLALHKEVTHDPDDRLQSRFALAQQALSVTPQDCGLSFGVLDLGLAEDTLRYLHAIRLVDRREDIAWGMHYRYLVTNDAIEHVDRLHVRCSTLNWNIENLRPENLPKNDLFVPESLPGMELPTEAQLMQLYLYPDIPEQLSYWFWTQEKVYMIPTQADDFPKQYMPMKNACSVVDENQVDENPNENPNENPSEQG